LLRFARLGQSLRSFQPAYGIGEFAQVTGVARQIAGKVVWEFLGRRKQRLPRFVRPLAPGDARTPLEDFSDTL